MKKILSSMVLGSLIVPLAVTAAPPAQVTNGDNAGPGSLRAALASGATSININPGVTDIVVTETLEYTGDAPLSINGTWQVIDGSGLTDNSAPILHLTMGANLSINNLAFDGGGGYSIENMGGGKGIFVQVPAEREGLVAVRLTNVTIVDTGYHGIHISDCQTGDGCGAGQGEGDEEGSPASISLEMIGVTIDGAGFGQQDGDGARVDDRGEGDVFLSASNSAFQYVGGDGIELDEGGDGDVVVNVRNSLFDSNGAYCADIDGDGDFDPIAIDPSCNDDGDPDVDDAWDIDEAGDGAIRGTITNLVLNDNYDEGLDFDGAGEGDSSGVAVDLSIQSISAEGNADEAIKVSVEDEGDVIVQLRSIHTDGDVTVEEEDEGSVFVSISGSKQTFDDVEIVEADEGDLVITINAATMDNLEVDEDGEGEGTLKVRGSVIDDIEPDGVEQI